MVQGYEFHVYDGFHTNEDDEGALSHKEIQAKTQCSDEQKKRFEAMERRAMQVVSKSLDLGARKKMKRIKQIPRAEEWYDRFFVTRNVAAVRNGYEPLETMKLLFSKYFSDYQQYMPLKDTFEPHTMAACLLAAWYRTPGMNVMVTIEMLAEFVTHSNRVAPNAKALAEYRAQEAVNAANAQKMWVTPSLVERAAIVMARFPRDANGKISDYAPPQRDYMEVIEELAGESKYMRPVGQYIDDNLYKEYHRNKLLPNAAQVEALERQHNSEHIKKAVERIAKISEQIVVQLKLTPLSRIHYITKLLDAFAFQIEPPCDASDMHRIHVQRKYAFEQMMRESAAANKAGTLLSVQDRTIAAAIFECAFVDTRRNGAKVTKSYLLSISGVTSATVGKCVARLHPQIGLVLKPDELALRVDTYRGASI